MGWTGSLNTQASIKDYIIKQFTMSNDTHSWELTDVSMRGNVAYGIHKVTDRATGAVNGEAIVILARKEQGYVYLKEIGETMHPYYYDAPIKLLDKLDAEHPAANQMAAQWRIKCREKSSVKAPKLKFGDVIKLAHPLTFNFPHGAEKHDTLTYVDYRNSRNTFRTPQGNLVRITNLKTREFTIQGA